MTTLLEIRDAALRLSPTEREQLSYDLIASIGEGPGETVEEDGALSPYWASEIRRRVDGFRSGDLPGVPWEEVRAELWRKLEAADEA